MATAPVSAIASPGPQAAALVPMVPAPRDRPFAGTLRVAVDATDTVRKIYAVHETIPLHGERHLVLHYPQWESGSHAATGSVAALAGLAFQGDGTPLAWRRDAVDVFAFHVDVPAGVHSLTADFQFLSPLSTRYGGIMMTPDIVNVSWNTLVLYPAGIYLRDIPVQASLSLPAGMRLATSLTVSMRSGDTATFAETTMERLVDSPVYAGRYFRRVELGDDEHHPVGLDLFAEAPDQLAASDEQLARLRDLVRQARLTFGARHFRRYELLVSLSDDFPGPGGIEHLESSESNEPANFFTYPEGQLVNLDLMAHEFAHSWNGRYRQPADLWTPTLNEPMGDSLLWVYEGQTQFWGIVLAARAGLRTPAQTLDTLAVAAAATRLRAGRAWKSLQESSNDSLYMVGHSTAWRDWTRREDYYLEGPLLWLAVDARLRELTGERQGLDDFAAAFFGGRDGDLVTRTYTFADVCHALDDLAPSDWAAFLRRRLDTHDTDEVLAELAGAGYRLGWSETPSQTVEQNDLEEGGSDFGDSIGLRVTDKGDIRVVNWNGSAFRAAITPGERILRVDGQPFSPAALRAAIVRSTVTPVELVHGSEAASTTSTLDYRGPLRYPVLERIPGTLDRLTPLLRAR